MPSLANVVEGKKVPLLYIYSRADPTFECRQSEEYGEMFGVLSEYTDVYDESATLVDKGLFVIQD